MTVYLIIVLVFLLIWNIRLRMEFPERMTLSSVDGNNYSVKTQFNDHRKASNILARLNLINKKLILHMKKKYANTNFENHIEFLEGNYNGDVLSEHIPRTTVNTSYVLNKGELIKLCLRDPATGKFHDFKTLLFVNLHELSHLLDKKYGHGVSFWKGFKTVLQNAEEIGIYNPVDYSKQPTKYCGLTISNNPYYRTYGNNNYF
jgi:hypothetical protein